MGKQSISRQNVVKHQNFHISRICTQKQNHTRQIEMLIKSTTDAMKEMMQLVKNQTTMQSKPTIVLLFEEKKKKIQ